MTFVSQAPNFEDVLLWRTLSPHGPGFYVDAGAPGPGQGSATQALYDRGWRGINLAADDPAYHRLLAARARDVTLPLREAPGLAALCRDHAGGTVHVLRVGVEDADVPALAAACRPWIVLAPAAGQGRWEAGLLAGGYGFAWFDGLSRFYLAADRHDLLAPRLQVPPNLLDGFVRAADLDALPWVLRAEARAAAAEAARDAAEGWLDAMRRSTSWRLTAPLRRVLGGGGAPPPAAPPLPEPGPMPASPLALAAALRFAAVPGTAGAVTGTAEAVMADRPGLVRVLDEAVPRSPDPSVVPEVLLCPLGAAPPWLVPPWPGLVLALAGENEAAEGLDLPGVGAVLAPSAAAAKRLVDAGVGVPVRVLPEGPGVAGRLAAIAAGLLLSPPPPRLDVAWITTWGLRCGIAEYSRQLLGALPDPGTVLADTRTDAAPGVVPAWTVADEAGSAALLDAIQRRDPRAVVVQHQPGLFPWRHFAPLLGHPALHGRVVCAVLHNTEALLDIPAPERALAVSGLGGISRVAVHTARDVERLCGLGLARQAVLMPHGAPPAAAAQPARMLGRDAEVVVGCFGFFVPGKGIPELIEALSLLRPRWPGLRLRLVNAEYPLAVSAEEIARARACAERCGVADHVAFDTRFEADPAAATARLAGCDLVVLPYQHSKEASSAALRSALSTGIPVAATPLPMFAEAGDAVLTLPGMRPAEIAEGIERALLDQAGRAAVAARAEAWMARHAWPAVGRRWTRLLRTLLASGVVAG